MLHLHFFGGHHVWHHIESHCPIQRERKLCRKYNFVAEFLNKSCLIALIPARCEHSIICVAIFFQCSFWGNIDPALVETEVVQIGALLMRNEAELRRIFCLRRRLHRSPITSRIGQLGASLRPAGICRHRYRYRRLRGRYRIDLDCTFDMQD